MNKFDNFSPALKPNPHAPCITVPARLPSRCRVFRDHEWEVVERSLGLLQTREFYWGPLSVHEAHARLLQEPVGTYLLRDSSQGNCLFSLSVRMPSGPISLRIPFRKGYFWLKDWFSDCVVKLLELVVAGTKANPLCCDEMGDAPLVFSEPLCRECRVVPKLEELCQQALTASSGIEQNGSWDRPSCRHQRNTSLYVAGNNMQMSMIPAC